MPIYYRMSKNKLREGASGVEGGYVVLAAQLAGKQRHRWGVIALGYVRERGFVKYYCRSVAG